MCYNPLFHEMCYNLQPIRSYFLVSYSLQPSIIYLRSPRLLSKKTSMQNYYILSFFFLNLCLGVVIIIRLLVWSPLCSGIKNVEI